MAQSRVFARADEAARAHSSLACCHLSARIFIQFKEPELFYFYPPHPEFHQEIDDETLVSDTRQLAPGGPSHPSRPRLGHIYPLIFDREALRASAHSLCPVVLYSLSLRYLIISDLRYPVVHTWTIEFQHVFSPVPRAGPFPLLLLPPRCGTPSLLGEQSSDPQRFSYLVGPTNMNFLRAARGSHGATLGKHTRLSVESNE